MVVQEPGSAFLGGDGLLDGASLCRENAFVTCSLYREIEVMIELMVG